MYINCKTSLLELKFLIIRINVRFYFIKLARKFFFSTHLPILMNKGKLYLWSSQRCVEKYFESKVNKEYEWYVSRKTKQPDAETVETYYWDNSPQNLNLMTMIVISSLRLYRVISQQNQLENSLKGIIAFNKFIETART